MNSKFISGYHGFGMNGFGRWENPTRQMTAPSPALVTLLEQLLFVRT